MSRNEDAPRLARMMRGIPDGVGTACGVGSPVHRGLCKMSSELLYMERRVKCGVLVTAVLG